MARKAKGSVLWSHVVQSCVDGRTKAALHELADQQGKTVSCLVRELLEAATQEEQPAQKAGWLDRLLRQQ